MSFPAEDYPPLNPLAGFRFGNVFTIEIDLPEDRYPFPTFPLLFYLHIDDETRDGVHQGGLPGTI